MTTSPIQDAIGRYFSAVRSMDGKGWAACFSEDCEAFDPVGTPVRRGKKAIEGYFAELVTAFERVSLIEDQIYICGNEAAVSWKGHGRSRNGKETRFSGIDLFEFDAQGKIKKLRGYWDPAQMMAQLK